jgi:hypothetical protein
VRGTQIILKPEDYLCAASATTADIARGKAQASFGSLVVRRSPTEITEINPSNPA